MKNRTVSEHWTFYHLSSHSCNTLSYETLNINLNYMYAFTIARYSNFQSSTLHRRLAVISVRIPPSQRRNQEARTTSNFRTIHESRYLCFILLNIGFSCRKCNYRNGFPDICLKVRKAKSQKVWEKSHFRGPRSEQVGPISIKLHRNVP